MTGRSVRVHLVAANGMTIASAEAEDVYNADTATPVSIKAEVQCDLGHWHFMSQVVLPAWSPQRL